MFRFHATAAALVLLAALAISGCVHDRPYSPSASYGEDRYYTDYSVYRQTQWDRYGYQRKQMLERERVAAQSERLRLERERLAWEKRETERLRREQDLRAQWERDKARYEQQYRSQQYKDQPRR
jgi:hypothetical protein